MKLSWYIQLGITVVIVLISASIFVLLVNLCGFNNLSINEMTVSFIGLIATFIVIGNYAQMQDVKEECISKMKENAEQNDNLRESVRILIEETQDYKSVQFLFHEKLKEISDKQKLTLWYLPDENAKTYIQISVYIKDIVYHPKSDTYEIQYLDEKKNNLTILPEWICGTLVNSDILDDFMCNLQSRSFQYMMKLRLSNKL